jgi:trans-aconitate 2-methyltransferase
MTDAQTTPRDWDADAYVRVAGGVRAMGEALLDRLELRGDERVLDAGCGDGKVTAQLLARVPRGSVVGVDGSPAMIEKARAALPSAVDLHVCDLLELELDQPVDFVFSSATFHWIADHDLLYRRLFAALRPGGRLLTQCGGFGNIAEIAAALSTVSDEEPYSQWLGGWPGPWNFRAPDEEHATLEAAGFEDITAGLHQVDVDMGDDADYLRTVIAGSHLDRLPDEHHQPFLEAVLARLPGPPYTAHYIRLTVSAQRPD